MLIAWISCFETRYPNTIHTYKASQQIITSMERTGRDLAPAGPPKGMMANTEMFFNWRGSRASHRPPIATEWVMDLLRNTLELDENMLQDMGGAIRSEIFGAALIMKQVLELVEMPDWMPLQYKNLRHNFESGMDRILFCGLII